jgi:hypothetical protein
MAFDVFISYPHQDQAVANAARAKLEDQGIRCWIAPRDIAPGAEWAASIVDAIKACRALVLIFSSYANESAQVRREVQHGFDQGKPVIPFRIKAVAPEKSLAYYLPSVHWLEASTPPVEQHLDSLVRAVRAALEGRSALHQRKEIGESSGERKVPEPLQIVVGEDGPFVDFPKGGPWNLTRRLKIAVRNNQGSKAITGCKMQITEIQPYSGYRGPWLLAENFTLAAGDQLYLPVVQYGEARDKSKYDCADTIIEVCCEGKQPLLGVDERNVLSIRATGHNVPFYDVRCAVWVDANGRLRISKTTEPESFALVERDVWLGMPCLS